MAKPGPKSSLESLPAEIKQAVDAAIRAGASIRDIHGKILELGGQASHGAVHRYTRDTRRTIEKLQRSREMAEAVVTELGESATEGKTGRLLNEMCQSLTFQAMLGMDGDTAKPQDIARMAKTLKDLTASMRGNQEYEMRLRDAAVSETLEVVEAGLAEKGVANAFDLVAGFREAMQQKGE